MKNTWAYTFPAEIMVCDVNGTVLEMNETAINLYEEEGGAALVGHNVFEHHPDWIREKVRSQVTNQKQIQYITEKKGIKKLVNIAPWYKDKQYAGFALIIIDLAENIRHIVKD